MDILRHLFSHLCGQVNCWHSAGITGVACQRCTGLYVGALISTALFAIFRPRPTSRSLWLHGLAMLAIIPFGYHLVPHGSLIRAITGQLFGYGMTFYLILVPADHFELRWRTVPRVSRLWYPIVLAFGVVMLLLFATSGRPDEIILLSLLSFLGLMTITYLVIWNVLILAAMGWIRLRARASVTS